MRILIDMQACQNASRQRGIGRYALSLIKSVLKIKEQHEIHLLFNKHYAELVPLIIRELEAEISPENIHIIQFVTPNASNLVENNWRNEISRLLLETYFRYIEPDIIFFPSYFEGFGDEVVTSLGLLSNFPTVVTLHDLIPLIYKNEYLDGDAGFARSYSKKIEEVKCATALITISESAAQEAVNYLGFARTNITNASEAADTKFRKLSLSNKQKEALLDKFSISKQFLFYTGGSDPRKNLPLLIEAFADLPSHLTATRQLVFAGSMPKLDTKNLENVAIKRGIEKKIRILGYVSDTDLISLYNLAELFVFPSYHEGFGLPPLEAMQCGAPVIASNRSSIPEVVPFKEALFDPESKESITDRMKCVLTDSLLRKRLIELGNQHIERFSWDATAQQTIDVLTNTCTQNPKPAERWSIHFDRFNKIDNDLFDCIENLTVDAKNVSDLDILKLSQAIANNRTNAENRIRTALFDKKPDLLSWRLEGPFDSSYSLSIVNRELAKVLSKKAVNVSLLSSEGSGEFKPNNDFLNNNKDIEEFYLKALAQRPCEAHIVSRNMYPPRVDDMSGPLNALHNYAWEETELPQKYVQGFNESLQFITVVSEHVKKILIDNGVIVPISVVGNGVDHWEAIKPNLKLEIPSAKHRFLHVSSCFPRKGIDVLLDAYGKAFTSSDEVGLIIKTFENPHNNLKQLIQEMQIKYTDYPSVTVIFDDLTEADLKGLYENCSTFVAPSRAEGFGLPIAEAILSGMNIITTNWSGPLDFCNGDNISLIDFNYAVASTHENTLNSVWAEPSVKHLTQLLRNATSVDKKSSNASRKQNLLKSFNWDDTAKRNLQAAKASFASKLPTNPKIGWISTYDKRCGIATYTQHICDAINEEIFILAEGKQEDLNKDKKKHVFRCWQEGEEDNLQRLKDKVEDLAPDVVVIQFNYGFFNFRYFKQFLKSLLKLNCSVVVTLHSTFDPSENASKRLLDLKECLLLCDRLLVHSVKDLNRLKALGLDKKAMLFPHGIKLPSSVSIRPLREKNKAITLASYGFALPNKGILELLDALKILRNRGDNYKLKLVNSEYPTKESREYVKSIASLIRELELEKHVECYHDFLSDSESINLINDADIVVYPYQQSGESASGAVRYGLAAGRPVAVTPLEIFDDVSDICHTLPGFTAEHIAKGLTSLVEKITNECPLFKSQQERARLWCESRDYNTLSQRMYNMLVGLHRNRP